ncbi:hypothetical protein B0T22DRAFT_130042 [Podospora appendiculata]|uniref:Uncharacterized protein n=1 Tax=Podospora appendiculata TaxID=314037 RepID=A0AAE0X7M0_9PEZI|nr:hypothetical protein B0T22DRAFT_130042 [Podospora appendiculata]
MVVHDGLPCPPCLPCPHSTAAENNGATPAASGQVVWKPVSRLPLCLRPRVTRPGPAAAAAAALFKELTAQPIGFGTVWNAKSGMRWILPLLLLVLLLLLSPLCPWTYTAGRWMDGWTSESMANWLAGWLAVHSDILTGTAAAAVPLRRSASASVCICVGLHLRRPSAPHPPSSSSRFQTRDLPLLFYAFLSLGSNDALLLL